MTSIAETVARVQDRAQAAIDDAGGVIARARNVFSGDAQFFSVSPSREQLRRGLDDASLSTKKDSMKGILAQMCLGQDMSSLFPDVVRQIHSPAIELRKFIYTFIVHYCDDRPNETLLSISAFQRDLVDRSIHVRSLALRVLSSIRINSIQPVVILAIRKAMTDVSPLVRRTAATALIKTHRISRGDSPEQSAEVIAKLIGDKHMDVVGAAASAWIEICPTRYDLLHREFRKMCNRISEANEWAQTAILRALLRYGRSQFSDPNKQIEQRQEARKTARGGSVRRGSVSPATSPTTATASAASTAAAAKPGAKAANDTSSSSSDSDTSSSDSDAPATNGGAKKAGKKAGKKSVAGGKKSATNDDDTSSRAESPDMDLGNMMDIDADHRLLLNKIKPLLSSASRSVVLHAVSIYYHCAPTDMLDQVARPVLRVLNGPKECVLAALVVANSVIAKRVQAFVPYVQDFYPLPSDADNERELKLRIMAKLATRDNISVVTRELQAHFRMWNTSHIVSAVHGMALVAFNVPSCSRDILRLLLPLLSHRNSDVVSEVVVAVRQVVCLGHDPTQTLRTIQQLARGILTNKITTPQARASVLWLVADNLKAHPTITQMAPDVFRTFLASFKTDPVIVRRQLLFLAQKIFLNMNIPASVQTTPQASAGGGASAAAATTTTTADGQPSGSPDELAAAAAAATAAAATAATAAANAAAGGDMTTRFIAMLHYLLELVKFDTDYDLRDAGNMLFGALDRTGPGFALLKAVDDASATKPAPEVQDLFGDRSALELTSMSHLVGFASLKYVELPEWAEECTAATLRDPPEPKLTSNPLDDVDSDTSTESVDSSDDDAAAAKKKKGSDSDSSSDDDAAAGAAASSPGRPAIGSGFAAPTATATVTAPRAKVAIKTIAKPSAPQLGKGERILQEFFNARPDAKTATRSPQLRPAAPTATVVAPASHQDPAAPPATNNNNGSDNDDG